MTDRQFLRAPLGLIRSSLCPLDFRATRVSDLPEFANMVANIRAIEVALGNGIKATLSEDELSLRAQVTPKWIVAVDLA